MAVNVWTTVTTSGNLVTCWAQDWMGSERGPVHQRMDTWGIGLPGAPLVVSTGRKPLSGGFLGTWLSPITAPRSCLSSGWVSSTWRPGACDSCLD